MKKMVAILLALVLVLSLGATVYASELEPEINEDPIEEYTSIRTITADLTRSGSTATCYLAVTQKIDLDSVTGTLKLLNSSGTTISTKSGTFTKQGPIYTLSKSFTLPSNGTYKVKFTIKTYKSGSLKETANGYTNTVTK